MKFQEVIQKVKMYVIDRVAETDALVPSWVNQAIRDAEERHNFEHMAKTFPTATAPANRTLAARPPTWKAPRSAPWVQHADGTISEIDWAASTSDINRVFVNSTTTGIGSPQQVNVTTGTLDVYPFSDSLSDWPGGEYVVEIPYWAFSPDMVGETDETPVLTESPMYVVYKATAYALIFNRDEERAATYLQLAEEQFARFRSRESRGKLGGRVTLNIQRAAYGPGLQPRRL